MPHSEIHVNDVDAAKAFCSGLFGWRWTTMPGGEAVGYHLAEGPGIGAGNGCSVGMLKRADKPHPPGSAVRGGVMTFDVPDCDASFAWTLDHGGAKALPPTDFPGIGRVAYVEDGQGNIVGMITKGEDN